jgi:hypothetical protein
MSTRQAAALVSEMTPDDRADLLEELAEENEERADEILAEIPEAARAETERLLAEPLYRSFAHQHQSYLARGRYHEQLAAWRSRFPDEQLLILNSERFFAAPDQAFRQVLDFLGLPPFTAAYEKHNAYDYRRMGEAVRRRLVEHYREPNRRLYEALDEDFGWSA